MQIGFKKFTNFKKNVYKITPAVILANTIPCYSGGVEQQTYQVLIQIL